MKGKERSPVKKRSREPDESRDRGGSKKTGAPSTVGSNNGASSRRVLPGEKRDMRDSDGHNPSSRTSSGYDYGVSPVNKPHVAADITAETSRSGSRSDPRPTPNPENEYRTLKITELGSELNDEEIEDGLFHEFKRFGDVSVKISRENDERVAFVNFRRPDDARAAKHARGKLVLYDRPLKIETVYTNRRRSRSPVSKDSYPSGPRHLHPQRPLSPTGLGYRGYRLQQLAMGRLAPPPGPAPLRDVERETDFSVFYARNRPPFIPESAVYRDEDSEDHQRANRTLFLGNLDISVTESDLRRAFDRFGVITEVDIKRPVRGQNNTYGFIKFENLDMAHRAKVAMSGKVVGHNPIKIGYGKPTPTTRLWVGGLGPWVPLAALAKEFDRFGTIRTIDYRKGEAWAYIQYESLDAAQAACTHMKGFPLGGPDRRLRVDFADTEHRYQQQQQQQQQQFMQLPLPLPHYDLLPEPFAHRITDSVRVRERSPTLPARFRDRDFYSTAEWSGLGVHDRMRGAGFDPMDRLERRSRDSWSVEHEQELQTRDLSRKRRHLDDGWQLDRSPESSDYTMRRHGGSLERSPGGSSYSDPERLPRSGRPSPVRDRPNNQDIGFRDKRRSTVSPTEPSSFSDKDRKSKASDSSKSPAKKEERSDHPSSSSSNSSSSKSNQQSKAAAGGQRLSQAWQGVLLLKNSSFPTSLHLLEGDMALATSLLMDASTRSQVSQLKINQRLRLDQPKLDEVSRRIKAAGSGGHSILLAVPGKSEDGGLQDASSHTERPLKNLVSYLKQKEAAGVISLPVGGNRDKDHGGVLHAFPPCEFSQQFLDSSAKAFAKSEDDYLVMIVIRGAS
ncbi:RNA-binding protein 15-like [Mastacembelus armatus]|uniref:RNA-binding protein 15 n=1 Tax=Mastacembelus armatus TaxID=205130 RepID=A0A3Q3NNC3_9TELE|nr:RNA-binding protein 15-like [Mastacembelus armatus]XP_033181080.1 RNA-binding protein 15-like [Mastacembelus armatus]